MSIAQSNGAPIRRNAGSSGGEPPNPARSKSFFGKGLNGRSTSTTDQKELKKEVAKMVHWSLPVLLSWGAITGLIFGGCCSNVGFLATFRDDT